MCGEKKKKKKKTGFVFLFPSFLFVVSVSPRPPHPWSLSVVPGCLFVLVLSSPLPPSFVGVFVFAPSFFLVFVPSRGVSSSPLSLCFGSGSSPLAFVCVFVVSLSPRPSLPWSFSLVLGCPFVLVRPSPLSSLSLGVLSLGVLSSLPWFSSVFVLSWGGPPLLPFVSFFCSWSLLSLLFVGSSLSFCPFVPGRCPLLVTIL